MAEKKPSRLRLLVGPARQREQAARRDFAIVQQRAQAVEDVLRRCAAALARQDEWARETVGAGAGEGAIATAAQRPCPGLEGDRTAAAQPWHPEGLGFYRQCAADLFEALHNKRAELARAQAELGTRRQELAMAMKQRKGLETAIRRREAEEAMEASRGEAKEMDQEHAARLAWQSQAEDASAAAAPCASGGAARGEDDTEGEASR